MRGGRGKRGRGESEGDERREGGREGRMGRGGGEREEGKRIIWTNKGCTCNIDYIWHVVQYIYM